MRLHQIYFSAAATTEQIVEAVAEGVCASIEIDQVVDYPLIKNNTEQTTVATNELAIFAIPVYAGRVPAIAAEQIRRFRGNNTRAIIVAVYGNREYDDALLELRDIVAEIGFTPVAAAAFVAEHSIFPKIAAGRPDPNDLELAHQFGKKAAQTTPTTAPLKVPGNNPYKTPGTNALTPQTNRSKCIKAVKKNKDLCGICATACPVQAIGSPKPSTNSDLCIKCAHCIAICPHDAREWGGLLYKIGERKFIANYSEPKSPETFYI